MVIRHVCLGLVVGVLLAGCASFIYRSYGLEGVSYKDGTLLGPKPADDLPFSTCEPTEGVKHPCVVMLAEEFFAFKLDYQDTQDRLKQCEKDKRN